MATRRSYPRASAHVVRFFLSDEYFLRSTICTKRPPQPRVCETSDPPALMVPILALISPLLEEWCHQLSCVRVKASTVRDFAPEIRLCFPSREPRARCGWEACAYPRSSLGRLSPALRSHPPSAPLLPSILSSLVSYHPSSPIPRPVYCPPSAPILRPLLSSWEIYLFRALSSLVSCPPSSPLLPSHPLHSPLLSSPPPLL